MKVNELYLFCLLIPTILASGSVIELFRFLVAVLGSLGYSKEKEFPNVYLL